MAVGWWGGGGVVGWGVEDLTHHEQTSGMFPFLLPWKCNVRHAQPPRPKARRVVGSKWKPCCLMAYPMSKPRGCAVVGSWLSHTWIPASFLGAAPVPSGPNPVGVAALVASFPLPRLPGTGGSSRRWAAQPTRSAKVGSAAAAKRYHCVMSHTNGCSRRLRSRTATKFASFSLEYILVAKSRNASSAAAVMSDVPAQAVHCVASACAGESTLSVTARKDGGCVGSM